MEQLNLKNQEINGSSQKQKKVNLLNINSPKNNEENKSSDVGVKNSEEDKNKINLPIPFIEHNIRNIAHNFIPLNSLSDKISEDNILLSNNNKKEIEKQKRNISEETLENGLNLDEQNLKDCYDNIESELNKLKNEKINIPNNNINNNKNIEENKNKIIIKNNNQINNSNRFSFNSNSQFEGDLYYYSDEDENNKKTDEMKEKVNSPKNAIVNKEIKINITKDKAEKPNKINTNNNEEKKDIKEDADIKKDKTKNLNLPNNDNTKMIKIDKKLLEKIEYAIDENGNPFSIKNSDEELKSDENNITFENKKPVAFIIQQKEKGKNYLIDTKGEKIQKMDDGYYNYKNDNIRLLIKDFDVQHPELRVFGARKRDSLLLQDIEEDQDKNNKDNMNIINTYKSIEIQHSNKLKDKLLNRNLSSNFIKLKNVTDENFEKGKKIFFNKNFVNMKSASPIMIKKDMINNEEKNQNQKDNEDENNHFNAWKLKENPKTDNRERHIFVKKRNKLMYKKINPKSLNNNFPYKPYKPYKEYKKFDNSDTIRRTNKILNKSVTGLYSNRPFTDNSRFDSSSNKKNLNNTECGKNILINNTVSNEESKKSVNYSQEIKNITSTTSKISLYKYKRLNKRGGSLSSNYYNNKIFNLKSLINKNSEYDINKDKNINNNLNNKNNLTNNNNLINKSSLNNNLNNNLNNKNNSFYNNSNIYNNKENKNDINFKKSNSSKYIISTIDKISNSIKYIKNKIEKNLIKINNGKEIQNLTEQSKMTMPLSTISTCNSQNNGSKEYPPYLNYYSYTNQIPINYKNISRISNISNYSNISNNTNELDTKINIPLNKNNKLSFPSKQKFQCAVLCKEVDDIISNYSKTNNQNQNEDMNIKKSSTLKSTIYNYEHELKTNENRINSFLNGTKNKINSNSNFINCTQRYNRTETNNKAGILNYKNSESCLMRNKLLNKLNNRNYNISSSNNNLVRSGIIDNNQNNFINKTNNKILHIKNKYSINLKSSDNLKFLNNAIKPTLKSKIVIKNTKLNTKSNSISSLKEIKLNPDIKREMTNNNIYNNNNCNNTFNNENNLFIKKKYNSNYIFTQRNNFNNKI